MEHCPLERAEQLADQLRRIIEDFRFHWHTRRFNIGVSIGVVPIDAERRSMQQLLSQADSACYAAKERGRNRVHVCWPGDDTLVGHVGEMHWASNISRALEKDMFRLYVQPIVPSDGEMDGDRYEVLLRLQDGSGNIVAPGAFLPAAERYNLSTRVDRWVLAAVLEWLGDHPQALQRLRLCSINLSGSSLCDEDFLGYATDLLGSSGVPAERLCFEITETAAISNLSRAVHFIDTIRQQGCCFALDDFGSGLSSFTYLKRLPVDYLKIDGAFVRDIAGNAVNHAVVRSINDIGHVMGKQTIAEFVEDDAILACVQALGVDYVQGFGIGRPQPLGDLDARPPRPAARAVANRGSA